MNRISVMILLAAALLDIGEIAAFYDPWVEYNRTYGQPGQMSTADEQITRQINDLLRSEAFSKGYDLVTFSVSNGDVTLKGSVATSSAKEMLEKRVRLIRGVRSLESNLSVRNHTAYIPTGSLYAHKGHNHGPVNVSPPPRDISTSNADKELNSKIREAGKKEGLWEKYPDVRLETSDGIVTLKGKTTADSQKLINSIQGMKGVKSVQSHLKTKTL